MTKQVQLQSLWVVLGTRKESCELQLCRICPRQVVHECKGRALEVVYRCNSDHLLSCGTTDHCLHPRFTGFYASRVMQYLLLFFFSVLFTCESKPLEMILQRPSGDHKTHDHRVGSRRSRQQKLQQITRNTAIATGLQPSS